MEFAIIVMLFLVAITNVDMVIAMKKLRAHSEEVELSPPVTGLTECKCGVELFDMVKGILQPTVEEEPVKTPSPPDESYSAWRNQKEEPKVAPPSPHGPPPVPGPLERPYGFSR